jgi:DNA-directed RNA polymerase specialized sigma24 family protein
MVWRARARAAEQNLDAEKRLKASDTGADEQLLVEAAQKGPARSADLYDRHFERVYAHIARRAQSREETQDLTSEVFHQALANIRQFEWRGVPFAAWLYRIAANALADHWRRSGQRASRDRSAGIRDSWGNNWSIATHIKDVAF